MFTFAPTTAALSPLVQLGDELLNKQLELTRKALDLTQKSFGKVLQATTLTEVSDLALEHYEAGASLASEAVRSHIDTVFDTLRHGYQMLVKAEVVPNSVMASAQVEKSLGESRERTLNVVKTVEAAVETAASPVKAATKAVRSNRKA